MKSAVLLLLQLTAAFAFSITFYPEEQWKGVNLALTGSDDECIDLPESFKPLSISTNGFCVRVFTEKDCKGETMGLFPASFNHCCMSKFDFNIKSLRSCRSAY